jgi:hypothetical protein
MTHFGNLTTVQLLPAGLYNAKVHRRSGTRLLDTWFRVLATPLCLALLVMSVPAKSDAICFLTVLKSSSDHGEAQNLVINDNAQWQSIWLTLSANQRDKPPLPEIDFTRRTIIAVFQGTQASSGYEISIEEIVESESSLDVTVKAFEPGSRCGVLGIVTRPLHIVEIEKTEKQVVFHVKHRIRNCG